MTTTDAQPDVLMGWMSSLSDVSRLRLLWLLEAQELGVAELCDVLQMPQSTVSRHLKTLAQQGWVVNRRSGTTNLYSMVLDELVPTARDLWTLTRQQTADWPTARQDQERLAQHMTRRPGDPKAFFAGLASEWTQTRGSLYGHGFNAEAIAALLPADWTVADLGCGSGQLAAPLARHVKHVIGVDNSPEMLATAKLHGLKNLDLREGELTDLPIKAGACNAALLMLVLTYLDDPTTVLTEMHRILTPGGTALIIDLLRHDREDFRRSMGQQSMGYTEKELAQLFKEAGFKKPIVNLIPPEQDAQGPALLLAKAVA